MHLYLMLYVNLAYRVCILLFVSVKDVYGINQDHVETPKTVVLV